MKVLPTICAVSVFALTIQLFISCKRYRPGIDDQSNYVFVSTAGVCASTVVSGQYHTGVALTGEHSITVQVNVMKVGQYNITTTKVNGIQFSATGKFTATGIQNVKLQGTGNPIVNGSFIFNMNGSSSCSFAVNVIEKQKDYAVYTINETNLVCQQPALHGRFIKGVPLSSEDRLTFNIHVVAPGAFIIFTNNINGIYFNATGTFSTAGDQTVVLYGFGTPADAGNFNFNLNAGNGFCSFKLSCAVL